jgi:hypothetical protein
MIRLLRCRLGGGDMNARISPLVRSLLIGVVGISLLPVIGTVVPVSLSQLFIAVKTGGDLIIHCVITTDRSTAAMAYITIELLLLPMIAH